MITLETHFAWRWGKDIIIGLLDSVCKARIDHYQLQSRRAGPSAASDIHYNAEREIKLLQNSSSGCADRRGDYRSDGSCQ